MINITLVFRRKGVKRSDIVMTADVNMYVMSPHVLDQVDHYPNHIAWISRYDEVALKKKFETFSQVSNSKCDIVVLWKFTIHYDFCMHFP